MRIGNNLSEDNSGVSILVEYVFIIFITAVFFGVFLLLVNSSIRNIDQTIVSQELGTIANDVANRISYFSSKVSIYRYNSPYWTSNVSSYSESIDLPELAEGKQYSIVIEYYNYSKTGNITVSYGSNINTNRTVSFRSGISVANSTISSTDASPVIRYDPTLDAITVVGY